MDFKSLLNKLDSMETPPETPKAPVLPKSVKLDEDATLRVLAGTSTILAEAEIMEKKLTKAEKEKKEEIVKSMKKDKEGFKERYGKRGEEVMHATATKIAKKKAESVESSKETLSELDMNLIKAAQKGQEGKPIGKPDSESDKNVRKKYGYRMDGEPAERSDDETKQDRRGRKRQNTGENIQMEADGEEGIEDLMAAVDEEIRSPGKHIDNLQDVMNATIDADDSPEYEKARAVINRYLEFVTNTDVDHPDDDPDYDPEYDEPMIRRMKHGDIARHIREYDLTDYLVAANDMLSKMVKQGESEGFDRRAFESKFMKMVEAKKMEAMKKSVKGKKAEDKMDEGKKSTKKKPDDDGDGVPNWADKNPGKDDNADKKTSGKKGMSAKQAKYFGKKKTVKESVEPKLSFREMMRLVVESGGQQQIDPLDKELFAWAERVAKSKFEEARKAEVYAGLVYERMGGRFEMYDVLSEDRK